MESYHIRRKSDGKEYAVKVEANTEATPDTIYKCYPVVNGIVNKTEMVLIKRKDMQAIK